jgi:hypothetical protein
MSETMQGDDSMPPTVGSGSGSLEVEGPEIYETSSATTTDGVLIFPSFRDSWLIYGSDVEFNHSDANDLTDNDDPSFAS